MTLKEKFEQYAKEEIWRTRNYNAEECELIAEEFAIGFADWIRYESVCFPEHKDKSIEELLEIYKKENKL
jgi:hypothetical protein